MEVWQPAHACSRQAPISTSEVQATEAGAQSIKQQLMHDLLADSDPFPVTIKEHAARAIQAEGHHQLYSLRKRCTCCQASPQDASPQHKRKECSDV